MKICTRCKIPKRGVAFTRKSGTPDGLDRSCRTCNNARNRDWSMANTLRKRETALRWYYRNKEHVRRVRQILKESDPVRFHAARLKVVYGMPIGEFQAREQAQGGVCAICRTRPKKGPLQVDHDHKSRAVRALLCPGCNTGLARFQESPDNLRAAIQYLERHQP